MKSIRLFSLLLLSLTAPPLLAETPRLLSPAAGQSFLAGEELRTQWEGSINAEEWEAFLSLDGGRTFPIRLTPHLSAEIHSFGWTVPALAANDARIRLRFGDERTENQLDFSAGFSIRFSPGGRVLSANAADIGRSPFAGEEESTTWVEGTSFGGRARVVAPPAAGGLASSRSSWEAARAAVDFVKSPETALRPTPEGRPHTLCGPTHFPPPPRGESARSILHSHSRLNV